MNAKREGHPAQPAAAGATEEFAGHVAGCETEIKFRLEKASADAVLASPILEGATVSPARELVSVYYDTAARDFQRAGLALRVRRKGKARPALGVKWSGEAPHGLFSRGEAEVACPGGVVDLRLFEPAIQARLAGAAGNRPLEPVFESRVKRRLVAVRYRQSEIELALDDGLIIAGEARLPLMELELELKSGNLHDLLDCAAALATECALPLDFEAKSDRGYRLAGGQAPLPQKAPPLELAASVTLDDLLAAVVSHTLGHFVSNWAALRESEAPEAIHQLRVALRRMRSGLGIFRRLIKHPELDDIRLEAKRLASALGPARDCDVFRQNALEGPFRDDAEHLKEKAGLLQAVELRRKEAYAAARSLFADTATTLFVLKVQGFVLRRAWRTAIAPEERGRLASPGRQFAGQVLDRLRRRALRRGKHLAALPDGERHELRILLKKLRYGAEFFGSLFAGRKEVRTFLKTVADLQDTLGAHNDAATAHAFIQGLQLPRNVETQFAAGYLLGWYRHATVTADAHLLAGWKSFKRADVFWK